MASLEKQIEDSLEKQTQERKPPPTDGIPDSRAPSTAVEEATATTANDKQDETPQEWLSGIKLWRVMGPLILVFFLVLLDTTIVSTASLSIV
jgi:hypothetical protein